jgi:ribosome-binding factor A
MKKNDVKIKKINSLIRKRITFLINKKFLVANCFFTITYVNTSYDLLSTNIYILSSNGDKNIVNQLNMLSRSFKYDLSKTINLRKIPDIKFIYDTITSEAIMMFNLIEQFKY